MDFVGKRNYFFILSAIIILIGIVGLIYNDGLNYDIQFQGGTMVDFQMENSNFVPEDISGEISNELGKIVTAQKSSTFNISEGNSEIFLLNVNVSSAEVLNQEELTKLVNIVREKYDVVEDSQETVRNVQPSIGKELREKSYLAVFISVSLIILYIWIRFQMISGLAAGVFAVVGLVHDTLIMLSVYAILDIPLNESFIAAVLTIIGYSMNDTVIIYDRIRENTGLLKKLGIAELVNKSIYQTLARSINTTLTLVICLVSVYAFAVYNNIPSIKEFSLPLIVGVISGGYSSIFIVSPLWVMWKEYNNKKRASVKMA